MTEVDTCSHSVAHAECLAEHSALTQTQHQRDLVTLSCASSEISRSLTMSFLSNFKKIRRIVSIILETVKPQLPKRIGIYIIATIKFKYFETEPLTSIFWENFKEQHAFG